VSNRSDRRPFKVGLFIPFAPSWSEFQQLALRAEAIGFDSVWVMDHLIMEPTAEIGGAWEGWSLLSALAATTRRVEVGTMVVATSFRNPALLAKMADTVDEISGGRLILGLGAGWHEPEYRAFGYPFDYRVSRFEEALTIIHTLLRKGEIDYTGKYYEAHNCLLAPRGPRPGGPPILIGSSGERMLQLVARYADYWNGGWFRTTEDAIPRLAQVEAACASAGREQSTLGRTAGIWGDNRAGAPPIDDSPVAAANRLRAFAEHGISHVQVRFHALSLAAVESFASVLEELDRGDHH
jgi:probable F420-dependent oxidoreductase